MKTFALSPTTPSHSTPTRVRLKRRVLPMLVALALPLSGGALGCGASTTPQGTVDEPGGSSQPSTGASTPRATGGAMQSGAVADLSEVVSPSVVNINTVKNASSGHRSPLDLFRAPRGRSNRVRRGAGSGFIIDVAGYVVTNAHVVRGADKVTVRLKDDRIFDAKVVGRDEKLDLALLKLASKKENLPAVSLGNSDVLRVGEHVVAVGNPFGLGHTVTMGIVSAKARSIGAGPYDQFIQTDASINPGNSGGPLFNLEGEVIGINTAIRAGADGIGFAIPVNVLKKVVGQLRKHGHVRRGQLGLAFQAVSPELALALGLDKPQGALVNGILAGSAADKAGIREGDVVLSINGVAIKRAEELPRNVAFHGPGAVLNIVLMRDGTKMKATAKLGLLEEGEGNLPKPNDPDPKTRSSSATLGLRLRDQADGGVQIMGMATASADLRQGDVIVEAAGKAIKTTQDFRAVVKQAKPGTNILLKLERRGATRFGAIAVPR